MVINNQKYPELNTTETDPEVWWNSLDRWGHVAVGGMSVHFGMMTAEYKWQCNVPYSELKSKQKKMVNYILKQKDTEWKMFPVSIKV